MTPGAEGHNHALDAEDAVLWAHVAAQVRPLHRRVSVAKVEKPRPEKPKATKTTGPQPATTLALRTRVQPPLRPLAPDAREKLPRTDERRLRRGSVAIGGRLDLHGMTRAEAHRAVGRFLPALAARGARIALVITGKGGRGASGEGVLRAELPRWLGDGALAEAVLAWRPAAPQHGGDGAFYVLLRRKAAR